MNTETRIQPEIIARIREEIHAAMGNEIFIVGQVDSKGMVCAVKIAARGKKDSVPVLDPHLDRGDVVLHNHPSGHISPSSADMLIAYRLGNAGIGFYIIDNQVENVYAVAEPIVLKDNIKIDTEKLASVLLPGGAFSRISKEYETRDSQVEMLKLICHSLNEDKICITEAGTGVGKSLAYLLPACYWCHHNKERIVVSTGTINLQQQLLEKDIPLVNKLLQTEIKAVLVKGRGNYLCINRLHEALQEAALFPEQQAELEAITQWAGTTPTGSRSDLSFYPSPEVWNQVCSEADICLGLRCRQRENCFVLKARKEAAEANLLIVNHHLLFADLEVRLSGMGFEATAVLPPFQRIIFDEAHNIEASATSFFSESFSRFSITRCIHRLLTEKKGRRFGLVLKLESLLKEKNGGKLQQIPGLTRSILESAAALDTGCLTLMGNNNNYYLEDLKTLSAGIGETTIFAPLGHLAREILKLCSLFEEIFDSLPDSEDITVHEISLQLRRLKNIASVANRFRDFGEDGDDVFWLEKMRGYRGKEAVRFIITPLDISETMQNAVYEPYKTLIFSSATLSVDGSFEFWKSRLGLNRDLLEKSFPSPFNYKENVLLGVPADAPLPNEGRHQEYVSDFILKTIEISEGRALVLFTSYAMLNQTYRAINPILERLGITLFKQGDDDRFRLLNSFRSNIGSVLFATDSFWEGVDMPGKTLELLIICKLPFKVPTDPVIRARMADIERKGGNPFMDYSLPEAVIKLKQGFGRLMRRGDDCGVVLILDSRIVKKRYGRAFLSSLPETRRVISEGSGLLEHVENFIADIRSGKRHPGPETPVPGSRKSPRQ